MTCTETWLYGSVARGTHTHRSDLDVLVISDDAVDRHHLEPLVIGLPQRQHLALRQYTWSELDSMAEYGSLFLLHLKLEGRPLQPAEGPTRLGVVLDELPPYRLADRDLDGFREALADVEWSLNDGGLLDFELGVMATVVRHCSILACYKLGQPTFDTADSVPHAFAGVGMEALAHAAVQLYDFRLAAARGLQPQMRASERLASEWLEHARAFVDRVGDLP